MAVFETFIFIELVVSFSIVNDEPSLTIVNEEVLAPSQLFNFM